MRVSVAIGLFARNALIFALGLCGSAFVLRKSQPDPQIPEVTEKLAQFAAGGPFDAVFLGSSKFFRGIAPAVFDAELERRGIHLHTYNLAIDGMGFPESAYLYDQLAKRGGDSLRWVFVELSGVRTGMQPMLRGTKRENYWRDWPRTLCILRSICRGEDPAPSLPLLAEHLDLFVRRSLNIGLGAERLPPLLGLPIAPAEAPRLTDAVQGFLPIADHFTPENWRQYCADVAHLEIAPRLPGLPGSGAALRHFARDISEHGAQPIFLIPPNPTPTRHHLEAGATGAVPREWEFDDPRAYPTLYERSARADPLHLSDSGARAFSVILADRFAQERAATLGAAQGKGVAP